MSNRTVLFKLTAGYTVIVLISMLTVGLLFVSYFRSGVMENRFANLTERARQIGVLVEEDKIDRSDPENIQMAVNLLNGLAGARVIICDGSGSLVLDGAGSEKPESRAMAPAEFSPLIERVLQGENLAEEIETEETLLVAGVPVKNSDGAITGAVLLLSPLANMGNVVDQASIMLGGAIILALLLTALMSFFYARLFTQPLESMQQAAMEMARGNYDVRVKLNAGDEMGRLGEALDLLAARLGYTIDQLFQEQSKLQDLFSSISEGILAFDPQMRLINSNQAAWNILGGTAEDGWDSKLINKLAANGILQAFQLVITGGERQQIKTDWNKRTIIWVLSPIYSQRGEIAGGVALIQDISESEQLERMRKEFVANVSHELRTPLTVIRGSAEALQDGAINDEAEIKKYYGRILGEIRGLERLVSDLLDLAQLQAGKIILHPEELDMNSLIGDVVQALNPLAAQKNIVLITELPNVLPPVMGDYDRLRQLLIIFIDNAIRHSSQNSSLWIEAEAGDRLTLRIKDNGPGIPAEDLPHIWDRFYKADKSRKQSGGGTGLGLSIARSLVDLHGGTVRMESVPGQGTVAVIELRLDHQLPEKEETK